jgi:hypothetical protein
MAIDCHHSFYRQINLNHIALSPSISTREISLTRDAGKRETYYANASTSRYLKSQVHQKHQAFSSHLRMIARLFIKQEEDERTCMQIYSNQRIRKVYE